MSKGGARDIFCKYFKCVDLGVDDLTLLVLYYSRGKRINLIRFMIFLFNYYRDSLSIYFEIPPIISLSVLRRIKVLILRGYIDLESSYIVLRELGCNIVRDLLSKIRRGKYVIVGSLVKVSQDFIRDLSRQVSSIENIDIEYALKKCIIDLVFDEFSGYDVSSLVKTILEQLW